MREEEFLIKRLKDLADTAYKKNIYTTTDFLNMAELSVFYTQARSVCVDERFYKVFGGRDFCERAIIMFGNEQEFGYDMPFPIAAIHIKPVLKKFSDKLSHRDFLGALLNLGIRREVLGDILVMENEAYVFCLEDMAEYIVNNLERVKHTCVKCEITKDVPDISANMKETNINVASQRLDAVIAEVFRMSRSASLELIRMKKVYVNGRLCENNSRMLKDDEVVSVRGYGRFVYKGLNYVSKKGRSNVKILIYVC